MSSFTIDHETYSCPTRWQELPVSDAVKLQALVKELPDAVADHFRSLVGPAEEVTPVQGDDVGGLARLLAPRRCTRYPDARCRYSTKPPIRMYTRSGNTA